MHAIMRTHVLHEHVFPRQAGSEGTVPIARRTVQATVPFEVRAAPEAGPLAASAHEGLSLSTTEPLEGLSLRRIAPSSVVPANTIALMSEQQPGERPTQFQIQIPPDLEGGVYANFLSVWHTAYEFTLDFAATQPPQVQDESDPTSPAQVPCRVVARVKIPATVVFELIRAINDNMTRYEQAFGEIRRPGQGEART
jgi:hypothetical protein